MSEEISDRTKDWLLDHPRILAGLLTLFIALNSAGTAAATSGAAGTAGP